MRCVVTGSAGFIGSHLCEELLRHGHTVIGIDCFSNSYNPRLKALNQAKLLAHPQFHFHGLDLRRDDVTALVQDADVIFHLAAMPGLSRSWQDFDDYLACNVQATQKLLQAAQTASHLRRFIQVSTSSVYGRVALGAEDTPPHPISPYGVTKLAAEQLCRAHSDAFGLPLIILRFFTVYGPRQRPDMAYQQFLEALHQGRPILVYGEGEHRRGVTYVLDCVQALLAAIEAPVNELYNVGGDRAVSVLEVLDLLEGITGRPARRQFAPPRLGDQDHTLADTTKVRHHLGWRPTTPLEQGLTAQWQWYLEMHQQPAWPSPPAWVSHSLT